MRKKGNFISPNIALDLNFSCSSDHFFLFHGGGTWGCWCASFYFWDANTLNFFVHERPRPHVDMNKRSISGSSIMSRVIKMREMGTSGLLYMNNLCFCWIPMQSFWYWIEHELEICFWVWICSFLVWKYLHW